MNECASRKKVARQKQVPSSNGDRGGPSSSVPPSTHGDSEGMGQDPAPSSHEDNGRDSRGRFTQGNAGGPGNPLGRHLAALRTAFYNRITVQDIDEVAQRLLVRAKCGNLAAMKLLLAYAIGRLAEVVNRDTLDVQEWQLHREGSTPNREVQHVPGDVPLPLACELARSAKPVIAKEMAGFVSEAFPAEAAAERREAKKRGRDKEKKGQQSAAGAVPRGGNWGDVADLRCVTPSN